MLPPSRSRKERSLASGHGLTNVHRPIHSRVRIATGYPREHNYGFAFDRDSAMAATSESGVAAASRNDTCSTATRDESTRQVYAASCAKNQSRRHQQVLTSPLPHGCEGGVAVVPNGARGCAVPLPAPQEPRCPVGRIEHPHLDAVVRAAADHHGLPARRRKTISHRNMARGILWSSTMTVDASPIQ